MEEIVLSGILDIKSKKTGSKANILRQNEATVNDHHVLDRKTV